MFYWLHYGTSPFFAIKQKIDKDRQRHKNIRTAEANPDYTGMSFVGSIVGTQGEQVEVAFDIDQTAAGGNYYGFAPATDLPRRQGI